MMEQMTGKPKPLVTAGTIWAGMVLLTMIVTAAILLYLTFIEKPSLRYLNIPFPALQKTVYPGDIIPLEITRCNSKPEPQVIVSSRLLENVGDDQEVLIMEMVAVLVKPGCTTTVTRNHRVPESTMPGVYRILGIATVPGVIRNFLVDWRSVPFKVIARPPVPLKSPP